MTDKLSEMILLQPGGVDAARKHEWADKARLLERQAEKWELEAKRLYGVGQDIEEMRVALEQRVEGLEKALYEAIEVGGAPESMWVDTDEETKRAWPIPDIDLKEALEALAAEEEA